MTELVGWLGEWMIQGLLATSNSERQLLLQTLTNHVEAALRLRKLKSGPEINDQGNGLTMNLFGTYIDALAVGTCQSGMGLTIDRDFDGSFTGRE